MRTLAALTSPSMSLPGRRGRAEVPSLWRDYAVAVYNFSFNLSVQAKREMKQREEREQNKQVRETKIPNLTLIVFRADFAARRSNARTSRCGRQTGPSGPSPAGRWPRVRQRADVPFRAPHRPRWTAACAERPRTFLPAGHANTRDGVRVVVVVVVVVVVNQREPEELWGILSTQRRLAVARRSSDHGGVTEYDAGEPEGAERLDSHRVPGDDRREGCGGRSGGVEVVRAKCVRCGIWQGVGRQRKSKSRSKSAHRPAHVRR